MTDDNLSENGLVSAGSDGDVSPQVQEVPSEHVDTQAITDQEKLFTQAEFNSMAGTVRRKAYEKGLETARTQSQPEVKSQQHGAGNVMGESQVRELVSSQLSEISRQHKDALDKKHIEDYAASIYKAIDANAENHKDEIPDFKEAMESVDGFANYPVILEAVHKLDDSAKILRYLATDEGLGKITALAGLSEIAIAKRIQTISNRLKQNENGKKSPRSPNPLSQIDTNVRNGMGGKEPTEVADFMDMFPG